MKITTYTLKECNLLLHIMLLGGDQQKSGSLLFIWGQTLGIYRLLLGQSCVIAKL